MCDYQRPPTVMLYESKNISVFDSTSDITKAVLSFDNTQLSKQQFTANQINGHIRISNQNKNPTNDARLLTTLIIRGLHEIKNREVPPSFSDLFKAACIGGILGGITGYYFDKPLTTAAFAAVALGLGRYGYKRKYPDPPDFTDVIGSVEAILKKKTDNNFPIVDLHTPDNGKVLFGNNYWQLDSKTHTPYAIAMHRHNQQYVGYDQNRLEAWLQIRKLVFETHEQQLKHAEASPPNWHRQVLQNNGQYEQEVPS